MRFAHRRGFLLLAFFLATVPASVAEEPLSGADIYRRTVRTVAWVHAADQGKGTGWVLDRTRRLLVTSFHVVGDNETVEVIFPVFQEGMAVGRRDYYLENLPRLRKEGRAVRGRVLRKEPETDLALIELESLPEGTADLPLAAESAQAGDRVHALGNRYDTDVLWVHTAGAVRQVQRLREGFFNGGRQLAKGARAVVAQAPVNEGDSGGPLVNDRGELVGVTAAVAWEAQGSGLFIDVSEVRALVGKDQPRPEAPREPPPKPAEPNERLAPREIYRRGLRSLALVQGPSSDRRASGWLLDRPRRLLLTTSEVVGEARTVNVIFPAYRDGRPIVEAAYYKEKGTTVVGCVLARDSRRNLALLELASVPEGVAEATLAADNPSPGDNLHVLGNPNRGEALWVYTAASVRQLGRANLGQTKDGPDPAVILVQAPLAEGEGGGPLLDERGWLVGMVSGKTGPQQQIAYGLTVGEIKAFVAEDRKRWDPRSAAELCERGVLFAKTRRHDRALEDFTAAIRLDPKYAPAHAERGQAYHLQGDDGRALGDCDRAIELDPKLASAYVNRAMVRNGRGEPAKAAADCDAALRLDPKSAAAFAVRGDARRLLGDLDRALSDCDEAIWLDRQLPAAHLCRGLVFATKNEHVKALADFERAIQLDPRSAATYRCRADSFWATNDVKAALADYEQALTLNPNDALAWLGRGRARAARNEAGPALDDLVRAVRLRPRLGAEALAEVERLGAGLRKDGKVDLASRCELYLRALKEMRPFFKDFPEIQKVIDEGLAAAGRETDLSRKAAALREALAEVQRRLRVPEPPPR
jgi:S1-C subfamily serine protease/Tfp pilus assembly protein PilF